MGIRKQTTEEFKEKVYNKYNIKIEILSEYNGGTYPINILYHCEKHGNIYKTINAKNIFSKRFQPCKKCDLELKSEKAKIAIKDKNYQYNRFKKYCEDKGGKLITKEWTIAKDLYEIYCGNPNHPNFFSTADSIMNKPQWCPYCCGRKGNFKEQIDNIIQNKNGEVLEDYINSTTHIKVKCNIHNYIWSMMPLNIKKGRWCPVCNLPYSEKVVYDYLLNNKYNLELQYTFDNLCSDIGEKLKFDFGILDNKNNLLGLIEVDDEEHRYNHTQPRRIKAKKRDKLKDQYCINNNINLFRLQYYTKWAKNQTYDWYYNYIHNELINYLNKITYTGGQDIGFTTTSACI